MRSPDTEAWVSWCHELLTVTDMPTLGDLCRVTPAGRHLLLDTRLSLCISVEFFILKMVRSDNVILHTLAGCSRDSVVALLDKYSPIDSHCEPSMLLSCVVKRWFRLYFSNLCQAVWPSIRSIHSSIVCPICTAFITVFFIFILFSFVYFSVHCTLCILVFYNHCCLVRINK